MRQRLPRLLQRGLLRRGIQHTDCLERRRFVERPTSLRAPLLEEASSQPQPDLAVVLLQRRQISQQQPKGIRRDIGHVGVAPCDRIAAVQPLAEREHGATGGDFRAAVQRSGAEHRAQHPQLRQIDADVAAEQPRPRAAGQHHGIAGDAAPLGYHAGDASALRLDAAYRALGEHRRPRRARRLGDRRRGLRRFGTPVGRRMHRSNEHAGRARHQGIDRGTPQQPRFHLILPCLRQPRFLRRDLLLGLAQIGDAWLTEAGLSVDLRIHAAPQPQALDRQRYFARVAPHRAAPAPVTAGLLAANSALLAQHHGVALLRQEQRSADADDAAADHHHGGTVGDVGIGTDRIDWRRHMIGAEHMLPADR